MSVVAHADGGLSDVTAGARVALARHQMVLPPLALDHGHDLQMFESQIAIASRPVIQGGLMGAQTGNEFLYLDMHDLPGSLI